MITGFKFFWCPFNELKCSFETLQITGTLAYSFYKLQLEMEKIHVVCYHYWAPLFSTSALTDYLFSNYSSYIRPRLEQEDSVLVNFYIGLRQVIDVDVKAQQMTLFLWHRQVKSSQVSRSFLIVVPPPSHPLKMQSSSKKISPSL